jgi:hypothetical protein
MTFSNFGFASQVKNVSKSTTTPTKSSTTIILIVDDVVLDETHQYIKDTNDLSAIGMVMGHQHSDIEHLSIIYARPLSKKKKKIPIIGESVIIYKVPTPNNSQHPQYVYGDPISLYGNLSVNYNPLPSSPNKDNNFDDGTVSSLMPYPGDIIYEGRFGQSLRFGSTYVSPSEFSNQWSSGTDKTKNPITIISNGQNKNRTSNGSSPIVEDFKTYDSLIYLTSIQKLNTLSLANENFKTFAPTKPTEYTSPQIVINSTRIILNAFKDSILISGEKSIGLLSNDTINIESTNNIYLNSNQILLGTKTNKEPALLGKKTVDTLNNIINALTPLITALSTLPGISAPGSTALSNLVQIQTGLELLKSNEVKLS